MSALSNAPVYYPAPPSLLMAMLTANARTLQPASLASGRPLAIALRRKSGTGLGTFHFPGETRNSQDGTNERDAKKAKTGAKRPPNSWTLFRQDHDAQAREENPGKNRGEIGK
jgi:hypothetical protein